MIRRLLPVFAALTLASCGTTPVSYNGEQYQETTRVDVFRSQMEVRGLHRVIGEGRMVAYEGTSTSDIREAFLTEARRRGAQGLIIQDPADRPYGSETNGPGRNEEREVTAVFIRYDEKAPEEAQGGREQGGFRPYEPGPAPAYGTPYQDPYSPPGSQSVPEPYRQY